MTIVDHGTTAVVECTGAFESDKGNFTLQFLRVWMKRDGRWQVIAGAVAK